VIVVLKKPVALTAAVPNTAELSHLTLMLPGKNLLPAIMMFLLTPTLESGNAPVAVKSVPLPNMFPTLGRYSDGAGPLRLTCNRPRALCENPTVVA